MTGIPTPVSDEARAMIERIDRLRQAAGHGKANPASSEWQEYLAATHHGAAVLIAEIRRLASAIERETTEGDKHEAG